MNVPPVIGVLVVGLLFYAAFMIEHTNREVDRLEIRLAVCESVPSMEFGN